MSECEREGGREEWREKGREVGRYGERYISNSAVLMGCSGCSYPLNLVKNEFLKVNSLSIN